MLCFAYGPNMCAARLRRRVPSAREAGIARLSNHAFRFHRRGRDGSAKADACFTGEPGDAVWGVLFAVDAAEEWRLDAAEGAGRGCSKTAVTVELRQGGLARAVMYSARDACLGPSLRPHASYKRLVVEGARQHGLPPDYVARIEAIPATEDPDGERDAA